MKRILTNNNNDVFSRLFPLGYSDSLGKLTNSCWYRLYETLCLQARIMVGDL